jgi:hypothetical protein
MRSDRKSGSTPLSSSPEKQGNNKHSSLKTYKNITSKKQKNEDPLCPFLCPHCATLGPEYLKSRYEPICMLSDSGDSIYSPMHEKYYEEHKSSVRNSSSGKVFIAAEVVDNLLKKIQK